MFIILDQSRACYDAPDIFIGYCETLEDLKNYFSFYDRNDSYRVTVIDTNQRINNGEYNCKEYTYKEILKIIDKSC